MTVPDLPHDFCMRRMPKNKTDFCVTCMLTYCRIKSFWMASKLYSVSNSVLSFLQPSLSQSTLCQNVCRRANEEKRGGRSHLLVIKYAKEPWPHKKHQKFNEIISNANGKRLKQSRIIYMDLDTAKPYSQMEWRRLERNETLGENIRTEHFVAIKTWHIFPTFLLFATNSKNRKNESNPNDFHPRLRNAHKTIYIP